MSAFDCRVDPEVREVRRLEVLCGDRGRRRRPDAVKARIVGATLAPGAVVSAVVSAVARRHGLHPQQVFNWRRRARRGGLVLPVPEEVPFVPVVPAWESSTSGGVERRAAADAEVIAIALGDVVVRVPPAVDGRLLAKVRRAVKAAG